MPVLDSRKVIGGSVWAKATAVSKDCKRIYGALIESTWLEGTVVEVYSEKKDGAKKSTTKVKAMFTVGETQKTMSFALQSLKKINPSLVAPVAAPNPPAGTTTTPPSPLPPLGFQYPIDTPTGTEAASAPPSPPPTQVSTGTASSPRSELTSRTATSRFTSSSASSAKIPIETAHGRDWFDDDTECEVNGTFMRRCWKMIDQNNGQEYTPGCDAENQKISALTFFMAVFPKKQLTLMLQLTNASLRASQLPITNTGEILKWFGVNILITRYEFGDRSSLWSPKPSSNYVPAPNFGAKTGMARERYCQLMRHVAWSSQPEERPDGLSSETYRWMLVDDFVKNINAHRRSFFSPSWQICVDESIIRWYGLGGTWINCGLPMYVAIDRKPEDGMEIQNACCANVGIMMQMKIVKSAVEEKNLAV